MYIYALISIDSVLLDNIGTSVFFIRTAYENSFILTLDARVFMITLSIVGPLLACVGCGNIYADDKETGVLSMIFLRKSKVKYHSQNLVWIGLCTFILVFIPLLMNYLVSLSAFPSHIALDNSYANPAYIIYNDSLNLYETLKTYNPKLFIFLSITTISIILIGLAILNYALTVLLDVHKYIVNSVVFIGYIVFNVVLKMINKSQFSLFNYLDPNLTNAGFTYIAILLLLIIGTAIVILIYGMKKEN